MSILEIFAPNKNFSGKSAGVVFVDGKGSLVEENSGLALKYFERAGYGIGKPVGTEIEDPTPADDTPEPQEETPAEDKTPVDIPGMPNTKATRPEWVEFAEGMGINTEGLSIAQMREKIIEQHTAN